MTRMTFSRPATYLVDHALWLHVVPNAIRANDDATAGGWHGNVTHFRHSNDLHANTNKFDRITSTQAMSCAPLLLSEVARVFYYWCACG
jgi:hypothetical protein